MNNKKQLARRIFLFGVIPVFGAILILLIGYHFSQNQQMQAYKTQHFNLVESSLNTYLSSHQFDEQGFRAIANQLLLIDSISRISIYNSDSQNEPVTNFGLQLPFQDFDWLNKAHKTHTQKFRTSYTAMPFKSVGSQKWLIVGLDTTPLSIYKYQGYLTFLISSTLALGLMFVFAARLHYLIASPLDAILMDVRTRLSQKSEELLPVSERGMYSELVETLNDMLKTQQSIEDDMRAYVELSTKELRETLETVEIQNIELDLASKNALQASKAKSEFLANTSHELRTPLNGILGYTRLLLKGQLSDQQIDYLSTIEQSAQGLLTIINDILDFSKLETGEITLETQPISIRTLIEDVFAVHAPQAHEKNLRLVSIVSPNVQPNLLGDIQRLKQVMTNLVSNAIKFSTRGNIVVRATCLSETDNEVEIKFSVSDNGIGLTEEQQELLFGAFSKVDFSDSQLHGGAGLGLAIAKGLIVRMNGDIGVESEPEQGSTFWFTVRLGTNQNQPGHSTLSNSLHGLNILVYDSDPVCRMEITHHLMRWGVYCSEESIFENIEDALLDPAHGSPIELIVLDAYTGERSFDREKFIRMVHWLNAKYRLPIVVIAPPSIQRSLHGDITGLNTILIPRPIRHTQLHQAICNQLNITQPLASPESQSLSQPLPMTHSRRLRILVVDDNPANVKLAAEFLKGLGVDPSTAESGSEALELTQENTFDLILMDVRMPGMDGLETTKLLRERESKKGNRTPIVALTAHAVDEQKTRLLLAGMDDYLSKPVSENDLKNIIERWIGEPEDSDSDKEEYAGVTNEAPTETKETPSEPEPAEEPSMTKPKKVFDLGESLRLSKNKPDLAKDMFTLLLESVATTKTGINKALSDKDYEKLLDVVHKFHGGCCYCGVPAMRKSSKILETYLLTGNSTHAEELSRALLEEIQRLEDWVANMDLDTLFVEE